MNPWIATVAVVASGLFGYGKGLEIAEGRYAKAALAAKVAGDVLAEKLAETELKRLDTLEANKMLAMALEDQANADPDADLPAFGADSLRRLNSRRGN